MVVINWLITIISPSAITLYRVYVLILVNIIEVLHQNHAAAECKCPTSFGLFMWKINKFYSFTGMVYLLLTFGLGCMDTILILRYTV